MRGHGNVHTQKGQEFYQGTYYNRNESNPEIRMPTWKSQADILIVRFNVIFDN